jgi:hypothetical protein
MVASTQISSFSGSVAADTGRAGQSGVVHVQDTAGTGEQLTLRLRISGVYKVGKLLRTLGCPFDDFGQLRCCQRVPVVSSRQYCAYVPAKSWSNPWPGSTRCQERMCSVG